MNNEAKALLGGLPLKPYCIISVWDMKEFALSGFLMAQMQLEQWMKNHQASDSPLSMDDTRHVSHALGRIREMSSLLELKESEGRSHKFKLMLDVIAMTNNPQALPPAPQIYNEILNLLTSFHLEAIELKFVFIPKGKIGYFASPPGEGLSSSTVNVLWGLFNVAIGYLLVCRVGNFELRKTRHVLVLGAGVLVFALMLAHTFGRLHGGLR